MTLFKKQNFFLDMLYFKNYHPFCSSLKEYIIKITAMAFACRAGTGAS